MRIIIYNIDELVTCKGNLMHEAGIIKDGFIITEEDQIFIIGQGDDYKKYIDADTRLIDGKGKTVTPGLIDSHTHVVYGGSRENELSLKLHNISYIDILKKGGGILSSVRETRKLSQEELANVTTKRLDNMLLHGTTTVESKSGYGLNFEDEVKMLKVNKQLNDNHPIDVVSTYLGAHAVPNEFKNDREGYIKLMIDKVIPYIKNEGLAEFIDCFTDEGVFTIDESRRILLAGKKAGLKVKIHADELVSTGGAELAAELSAVSAEHLVGVSQKGISEMSKKGVVAVLLPCTSFYVMLQKFAPAREMIEKGINIALSTDCNPGTSPTESLQQVMTFACFGMKLLPEEIIVAMTRVAAKAVSRENIVGSLEEGKLADIVMFDTKNLNYLCYHFGSNQVNTVIKRGKIVVESGRIVC